MNRTSALLALDLHDPVTPDQVQTAFRQCAKRAHPDLNGGTEAQLRHLILSRDVLMHQFKFGVDRAETVEETPSHSIETLTISLRQALKGGVLTREVPVALELVHDAALPHSLMHKKTLRITLPKGLRHNDRLRLKATRAGTAEHVFRIDITCDEGTHIAGNDIWMTADIDTRYIQRGGTITLETPHGPQELTLPRTVDGTCLCLKNLGLPATDTHPAGHLYIRLQARTLPAPPAADLLAEFHKRWA